MFKKILVATDLSAGSDTALRAALHLGRDQAARVVALHVVEKSHREEHWLTPLFQEELAAMRGAIERERDAAVRLVDERVKQLLAERGATKPEVEPMVRAGRAADAIIEAAAEVDADLVIVGTRGRVGAIGSVAERVVRDAHRPVLVVPNR